MRTMRIPAALCSAIAVAALLAGCGKADRADDHNNPQPPSASASVKPVKPSQAETPSSNTNELPPESDALKPGDGKDLDAEQRSIDAGTPDPCRLITMTQWKRIVGSKALIGSHGGGPYGFDGRNCFLVAKPGDNPLVQSAGTIMAAKHDGSLPRDADRRCGIAPLDESIKEDTPGECTIINFDAPGDGAQDPYGMGFDDTQGSPHVADAWFKLSLTEDGQYDTSFNMVTANGYYLNVTFYGGDVAKLLNLARATAQRFWKAAYGQTA